MGNLTSYVVYAIPTKTHVNDDVGVDVLGVTTVKDMSYYCSCAVLIILPEEVLSYNRE